MEDVGVEAGEGEAGLSLPPLLWFMGPRAVKLSPNSHTEKRDWEALVGVLSEEEEEVEEATGGGSLLEGRTVEEGRGGWGVKGLTQLRAEGGVLRSSDESRDLVSLVPWVVGGWFWFEELLSSQ